MEQDKYLTVVAITKYIEKKFEVDPYMKQVFVRGEISNLKQPASGHLYFTVKDEFAMLRSVMFHKAVQKIGFVPEDGMNVLVTGRIGVFTKAGRYQFYAEHMEPDGVGALYIQLEQLKAQLEKEGLFAETHKKVLPSFPSKVAVVTSKTGAAVRDILTTIHRRMPSVEVIVYPTIVQGEKAAQKIVENIGKINQRNDIDVMIIGRGGGSLEELWAFNEEPVVRAVYDSDVPVISAVGHETDFALSDFSADVRAATPTAAAELAVPDYRDLEERLAERKYRLLAVTRQALERKERSLEQLKQHLILNGPKHQLEQQMERTDYFSERLNNAFSKQIFVKQTAFDRLNDRLHYYHPNKEIELQKEQMTLHLQALDKAMKQLLKDKQQYFFRQVDALEHLSPLSLLKRGFGVTYKENTLVKSVQELEVGDNIQVKMQGGHIDALITAKEEDISGN
ncbi:TPA_asm: exodeoxyribonuclease VII large subunit [Listeria monocytogenes]|uniref:Exodeoxyribonuclease 7 large subunit n=1 Tax=Listeria monocytogenes TaxID=1639 RepID=A0A6Y9A5Q8_LISMN|nr:exodeoxyribonuclease VII large subunit [Listeria monocytogenes]EAD3613311.1 exodeoxyribonuclease VII large subunit [Listeria monocytogenes]EAD3634475.1 exodeoxyribonuclease VII large subunit [Listeria monocytogenes]EAD3640277.1 exodeoxyribonuclease VII large subunit [Listeria monocytogenes]EAD5497241.1 exodeoxyribonuclease VII large subunit [Listeria monocytogenes]EAE1021662.1 exodeoxyribonuclease VII large subunit [Listeria monocytogenes]